MEHLPALTALGSSTVNSYRRLWDAGFWAPVYADWGGRIEPVVPAFQHQVDLNYRLLTQLIILTSWVLVYWLHLVMELKKKWIQVSQSRQICT